MRLEARQDKINLIIVVTTAAIAVACLLPPIQQDPSYHLFADQRSFLSVPNFLNVATNLPFLIIGIVGIRRSIRTGEELFIISLILCLGMVLTGFGSAYYHYHPDNSTLVYDRIPMTVVFMSFLSLTIAKCIGIKAGKALLFPLIGVGVASVLWWQYAGDLRFYGFVQFYPIILIPLIFFLFPPDDGKSSMIRLAQVIAWYGIAKLCEHFDKEIFAHNNFISGHSLKHLAAAVATCYMIPR